MNNSNLSIKRITAKLRNVGWVLTDIVLVNLSVYFAYLIRGSLYFDNRWKNLLIEEYMSVFWQIVLAVTIIRISIFFFFRLYKPLWRYASIKEFISILKAVTLGTVLFILIMYISRQLFYSRGIVAIDWLLNIVLISGTKFSSRIFHEYWTRFASGPETRVLIVGAGTAGQNALRELRSQSQKRYRPVGFIDDDPENHGKSIQGVEVIGMTKDIPSIVRQKRADEILLAVGNSPKSKLEEVTSICDKTDAKVIIVPGIQPATDLSYDPGKVLVIGGAGFIGSVMVRKLLQKGYKVRVLDSLLYGEESIAELHDDPKFELFVGDFRHVDTLVRSVRDVDAVIHLGGIVGDPACQLDPEFAIEVNFAATRMIKDVCAGFGIKRFIFASTCSVYGADDNILDENSPLNPLGVYARSKVDSEKILLNGSNGTLKPTIFRLATVFGLSYRPRFDLVINTLSAKAVEGEDITIFGGNQWRPFIHVDDVARAFIICLESPLEKVGHNIFNIGDNNLNCQIFDIGNYINKIFPGSKIQRKPDETDKRNYRVCFDKVRNTLNFTCNKTIQDGILEIKEAIEKGLIGDYRDAQFSNILWLEKQPDKREIFFGNLHYE